MSNKNSLILIVIFLLMMLIFIVYYLEARKDDVIYTKSDIDNELYLVRNLKDKNIAANMLSKIKQNIFDITKYLIENKNKYDEYKDAIDQLNDKIKNVIIMESSENSVYTSYSVNKGEQIIFCLRSRKERNKLHDFNMLMYVVLHEMAHVASKDYGHTPLFKKNFAFITERAIELRKYDKINFANNPMEYCGMTITDSII
jgi:predicted metal-dependent hydrolase